MPQLELTFFGTFQATLDGQPLQSLRSTRLQSLLAYLALEPNRPHSRESLAAHFWPDEAEDAAKQNLRQALYQLRQRLGDEQSQKPFLLLTRDSVEFNSAAPLQLDTHLFLQHLKAQRLADAIALYQGELLADLRSDSDQMEEWLVVQREHFRLLALDALQKLTELELAQKNYSQAQQHARHQLELEPWREIAHRQLMTALAAAGDRTAALAHYETCCQLLRDELGVEPDAETKSLVERIRDGNYDRVTKWQGDKVTVNTPSVTLSPAHLVTDWGDMPEVKSLHGREEEMAELERWLLRGHCRLVTIVGMGGMGKTTLAARATRQFAQHFDTVIWRSLLNAPPQAEIVRTWLGILDPQSTHPQEGELEKDLAQLFTFLRQQQCLLVLDNVESILQSDEQAGHYRPGYEMYGQLFRRIGETSHRSTLLLTTRETPQEVARLERESESARVLPLRGVSQRAGLAILRRQGLTDNSAATHAVVERYSGNPLALMLVAETIQELFEGDVDAFLGEEAAIFDDIRTVLDQQFARLTTLERDILFWLAIEREPVGLSQLSANLQPAPPARQLIEALNSLRRRSLLEKSGEEQGGFLLQNVVTEYLTDRLIEAICDEVQKCAPQHFKRHALIKAQAKEYVRQSQLRLIVQPIVERLGAKFTTAQLEDLLRMVLTRLRADDDRGRNYGGGNLFNLLLHLGSDPATFDFSQLAIWQAYLADAAAPAVDFTGCNFKDCVFTDKFGSLVCITFSPSGEWIAAGSSVGNIRIWRASDGQALTVWHAHDTFIFSLLFSPDGKTLYSCSDDQRICMWNVEKIGTGDEPSPALRTTLAAHQRGVWRLGLSRDGNLLVSSGGDGLVFLWDARDGTQLATHQLHSRGVRAVAIDPLGSWVASGDEASEIILWQPRTNQIVRLPKRHSSGVLSLAFSRDGSRLASGDYDGNIQLWAMQEIVAQEATPSSRLLAGHLLRVTSLQFSPDDRLLASSSNDQTVRLWEVERGELRQTLQGHRDAVNSVAFSPNGRILASGSDDRSVRLWEVAGGYALRSIHGHTQGVLSLALSPDGNTLASAAQDHRVRIWQTDAQTVGCRLTAVLSIHQKEVASVAFHPSGDLLASGSVDQTIQLWDLRNQRILRTLRGHSGLVRQVVFSRDGRRLVSGSNDYSVRLWDVASGKLLHRQTMLFSVWSAAESVDGKQWAFGGTTGTILLMNFANSESTTTLHGHNNWVTALAWSPDGKLLASGSGDQLVLLWDADSGERRYVLNGHQSWVYSVAFSPDGRQLATASADRTVCLWDLATQQLISRFSGHSNEVRSVVFSPQGDRLFSASMDETIRCWEIASGSCVALLRAPGPYESMKIGAATGITPAQRRSLLALGAVEG